MWHKARPHQRKAKFEMSQALKSHSENETLILTLDVAEHHTHFSAGLCAAGIEVLNTADQNPDIHAIVITTAQPHHFGPGVAPHPDPVPRLSESEHHEVRELLGHWLETLQSVSKPVTAALEGRCTDAGLALALACDFVLASDTCRFQLRGWRGGLPPEGGLSWQLLRQVPHATAMAWLTMGHTLEAQQLHHLGLINRLCPSGSALAEALRWSEQLPRLTAHDWARCKEERQNAPQQTFSAYLSAERARSGRA